MASRVLNDDPQLRARDETRRKVREAAAALNYKPNSTARSLRMARSGLIGLFVPDLGNPVSIQMIKGVEHGTRENDLQVLLGRAEWLNDDADFVRSLALGGRVDGLLMQVPVSPDPSLASRALRSGLPVVLLNDRNPLPGSVTLDDEAAGYVATQHLLDLGHRRVSVLSGVVGTWTSDERDRGVRRALDDAGLEPASWTHVPFTADDGHDALVRLHQQGALGTAVVATNVNSALGALRAAAEIGVKVPDQLSIIGIHDSTAAPLVTPGLTTVRLPLVELGRAGVRELVARMAGAEPRDVTIREPAPEIVRRGSTAPAG